MSDEVRIITNNHPRETIDAYELTADERAEFDYLDWPAIENGESSPEFVRFRGELYDLGEFMTTHGMPEFSPLRAWDGYMSESFFSGLVVKYVDDEAVIVGRYLS